MDRALSSSGFDNGTLRKKKTVLEHYIIKFTIETVTLKNEKNVVLEMFVFWLTRRRHLGIIFLNSCFYDFLYILKSVPNLGILFRTCENVSQLGNTVPNFRILFSLWEYCFILAITKKWFVKMASVTPYQKIVPNFLKHMEIILTPRSPQFYGNNISIFVTFTKFWILQLNGPLRQKNEKKME